MTALLTRHAREGVVDMVAVQRFAVGDPVDLTDLEQQVAIHSMARAGVSVNRIAKQLHTREDRVKKVLRDKPPSDSTGYPIILNLTK